MRLQIILIVSIVDFALKHVESYPQVEDKVYNVLKNELQSAKIENFHKKTNFLKKNDMQENSLHAIFKRCYNPRRSTPAPGAPGCLVEPFEKGYKMPVGKQSIDVDECIVYYCNSDFVLQDFECKIVGKYREKYPSFYQECLETGCL